MADSYRTVSKEEKTEIVIQKSRFIGHTVSIQSEEQAQEFLGRIRGVHREASHNCYAYIIGLNREVQRFSDDGEPGGTAGMPILEVMKNNGLTNTIIVVTRYFGGVLLGAGGLVRAYSQTAAETIRKAVVATCTLSTLYQVTMDYSQLGKIENFIRNADYLLKNTSYTDKVTMDILVQKKDEIRFYHDIMDISDGSIEPKPVEQYFYSW